MLEKKYNISTIFVDLKLPTWPEIFLKKKHPPQKKKKVKLGSSAVFFHDVSLFRHTSGAEGMPRQSASLAAFRERISCWEIIGHPDTQCYLTTPPHPTQTKGGVGSDPKKKHKGVEKKTG